MIAQRSALRFYLTRLQLNWGVSAQTEKWMTLRRKAPGSTRTSSFR